MTMHVCPNVNNFRERPTPKQGHTWQWGTLHYEKLLFYSVSKIETACVCQLFGPLMLQSVSGTEVENFGGKEERPGRWEMDFSGDGISHAKKGP